MTSKSKNDVDSCSIGQSWKELDQLLRPLIGKENHLSQLQLTSTLRSVQQKIKPHLGVLRDCGMIKTFESYILQMFAAYFSSEALPQFLFSLKAIHNSSVCGDMSNVFLGNNVGIGTLKLESFIDSSLLLKASVTCAIETMKMVDNLFNLSTNLFEKSVDLIKSFIIYNVGTIDGLNLEFIFDNYFEMCTNSGQNPDGQFSPDKLLQNSKQYDNEKLADIDRKFHDALKFLFSLSLFDELFCNPLKLFLMTKIKQSVTQLCSCDFASAEIEFGVVEQYAQQRLLVFAWDILSLAWTREGDGEKGSACGKQGTHKWWKNFIQDIVIQEVALFRIEQIFNMIVEYPDSQPAIGNLIYLLKAKNLSDHLVNSVKSAFETRLLHPGANTSEILTQYINAIKVLQQFDETCSILDRTCAPLIKYLRSREDTVRCIVGNMTEDAELAGELLRRCELQVAPDPFESDDEDVDWRTWKPKSRDFAPSTFAHSGQWEIMTETPVVQSHRNQDIMSILVNIYESKEIFVNEYRSLLADRILHSSSDFDLDKEIRHLELLSYKFGHDEINKCNVMLRDVAESKRTNDQLSQTWSEFDTNLQPEDQEMSENNENSKIQKPEFPIRATILSAQFWPTLKDEKLELPPTLKLAFQAYKMSFESVKQNRTVEWLHQLGKVDIELETNDGSVRSFTVTPAQAAVLSILESHPKMNLDDLSSMLAISTSAVRRKLGALFSLGVLVERNGIIEVVEDFTHSSSNQSSSGTATSSQAGTSSSSAGQSIALYGNDEDDNNSAMANDKELKEEEMKCYWMYTVSMLRNLKSMSAENIHSMIKMFSKAGNSTELSQDDLTAFLNKKVREELLCYSNGVYRLPNKN
ncbi:anaphase-promoting complex subunit 2-like isoform X2 [Convolutriloba macropyga]|uniref:anaphase-promoting complex subunit 2-like isoform X2 n=1 Tax=Convolutriloba macropyga TaxID=536237 RepID=UPI003F51FC11